MKINTVLLQILATNIQQNVNTCNDWGFGGDIKNVYDIGGSYSVHIGKTYYRHSPPQKFVKLTFEGVTCETDIKKINNFLQENALSKIV